jgi:hypothetical protein
MGTATMKAASPGSWCDKDLAAEEWHAGVSMKSKLDLNQRSKRSNPKIARQRVGMVWLKAAQGIHNACNRQDTYKSR